ncbi:sugar ABC transporter substrate-binding protein [Ktedonobacteria bacterium brp13]|nr:sugar ABC transporter substrate-binding protein [Ktedonobacteria bacterium brp13]
MRINKQHPGLRKLAWVAALMLLVVLSGCGSQTTSTTGSSGSDTTKLAVVVGGPHPYFAPMPGATKDAQTGFHISQATYRVPTAFTLNDENQAIESLASQGYNAFAIYPDDANGSNATIAELKAKGISVAEIGACTKQPSLAAFCLATDVSQAAYDATKNLIQAMGGKGKIVHLTGQLIDPNTTLREQAVQKAVAETNGAVQLVQTIADIDSPGPADTAVHNLLAAQGNTITGIVATAYNPAVAAAKALTDAQNTHIKLIGIDTDPIVIKAIQEGYAAGTMEQNPYGQAYIAAYALDLIVSHGCKIKAGAPFQIDSGTTLIDKSNVGNYVAASQTVTQQIQQSFKSKYLSC